VEEYCYVRYLAVWSLHPQLH